MKLFSYPVPLPLAKQTDQPTNPNCVCPSPMQAFFCTTGHLLECHSGMSCDDAQCSHLPRYDDNAEHAGYSVENAPCWSVEAFHGETAMFVLPTFAPTAEIAEKIVREWIKNTENFSQCELNYKVNLMESEDKKYARQEK